MAVPYNIPIPVPNMPRPPMQAQVPGQPSIMDRLRNNSNMLLMMGLGGLSGQTGSQQAAGMAQGLMQGKQLRSQTAQKNQTLEYLRNSNPDVAAMVEAGMSPSEGLKLAYEQKVKAQEGQNPMSTIGKLQADLASGRITQDQYNQAAAGIGKGGVNVYPSPPAGYMFDYDEQGRPTGARPIAGTPQAMKAEAAEQKEKAKTEQAKTQATVVRGTIKDLKGMIKKDGFFDLPETGIVGSRLAENRLNQEAVDVEQKLATIQASVAFDRLQRMRDASPTGGALGAVSERELSLLQSAMGALSNKMSAEELTKTLDFIDGVMAKFEAYPDEAKNAADVPQNTTPAPTDGVVSYQDYFGAP